MTIFGKLRRDEQGGAVIEMAIAIPVVVLFIYGIFQMGLLFLANAGMQHALGEGARLATIWPTPSNTAIETRMQQEVFGDGSGTFTVSPVVNGTGFKTLSVTYSMPMSFIFFDGPTVSITRSKKVYTTT